MSKKNKVHEYLDDNAFRIRSECTISVLETKLKIINAQLSMEYARPVIHTISSRIKSYESLHAKLIRKNLPETIRQVEEKINDLVGIRAVCTYTDDVYRIEEMLKRQKDIRILKRKDYIESPKPSGYRSLHLILETPIAFRKEEQSSKIEVQIRTAAMDYWAGLDYQLQYKKENARADSIRKDLTEFSVIIEKLDKRALQLRRQIDELKNQLPDSYSTLQ